MRDPKDAPEYRVRLPVISMVTQGGSSDLYAQSLARARVARARAPALLSWST
jgi:hypothetical protein